MKMVSSLLFFFSLVLGITFAERSFTDNRGIVFKTNKDKLKIVSNARAALSLFRLGLKSDQLVAVYDNWRVRGSQMDLNDPNNSDNYIFSIDPNQEEIDFLKTAVNLSPGCTSKPVTGNCASFPDPDELDSLEFDFMILMRSDSVIDSLPEWDNMLNGKVIWIDDKYDHDKGCYTVDDNGLVIKNDNNCYTVSLLDNLKRLEELTRFLGVQESAEVFDDRQKMCQSAEKFVEVAKDFHDKGLYMMAATIRQFNMRMFVPKYWPFLRTLEVLGAPIINPPLMGTEAVYTTNFFEWIASENRQAIPVDFWLFDSRSYPAIETVSFQDPAVVADQFSTYFFNDGPISYRSVTTYLDAVASKMKDSIKVHARDLTCVVADVTSSDYRRLTSNNAFDGFVCFNEQNLESSYTTCPDPDSFTVPLKEMKDTSTDMNSSKETSTANGSQETPTANDSSSSSRTIQYTLVLSFLSLIGFI